MASFVANSELAQRTLEELASFGLPAIPEHYLVWYRYLEGHDPALVEEINQRFELELSINSPFLLGLFDRFCFKDRQQRDDLDSAMQSLETESSGLLGLAHAMSGSVGVFGAEIDSAVFSLSHGDKSKSDLLSIIQSLAATSEKTKQQNEILKQKIETVVEHISETRSFLERIEEHGETDALTKLINRRQFTYLLEDKIAQAVENETPFSLIICNVDKFKQFNFAFGYQVGDQALVHVANLLRRNTKGGDIIARIHGDEFAIALPQTPLSAAVTVAESLRTSVGNSRFLSRKTGQELGKITMSLGVAELHAPSTIDALLEEACANLREAKQNGGGAILSGDQAETENRTGTA